MTCPEKTLVAVPLVLLWPIIVPAIGMALVGPYLAYGIAKALTAPLRG